MDEIASAKCHTLLVDESTNISVSKCLILYFKYRTEIIQTKSFLNIKLDLEESYN